MYLSVYPCFSLVVHSAKSKAPNVVGSFGIFSKAGCVVSVALYPIFFSASFVSIYLSMFFLGRPLTPSTDLIVLDALSRTLVVFHSHKLFTPLCLKISRSTYWTNDILPILFLISGYSA